ncbi:MAG: hypothetical protein HZC40_24715 [Chloroflexi bacterium]|nr:hypothetical protein [Chloroflexota bacterium]
MTNLEQMIMREVAELSESRRTNVLAYVRFLKLGLDMDKQAIAARFEQSWARVRMRARELNITEQDIEAEIRAVREGK